MKDPIQQFVTIQTITENIAETDITNELLLALSGEEADMLTLKVAINSYSSAEFLMNPPQKKSYRNLVSLLPD